MKSRILGPSPDLLNQKLPVAPTIFTQAPDEKEGGSKKARCPPVPNPQVEAPPVT